MITARDGSGRLDRARAPDEAPRRLASHARIINLETVVTGSQDADPGRSIHYRMHPANVTCLTAAGIDCCALANGRIEFDRRAGDLIVASLRSLEWPGRSCDRDRPS